MDEVKRLPVHVSIIMDGNGRWAQERGKERIYGHAEGVESVRSCTEAAREAGVRYLSLFAFSEENWSRPDGEVGFLMEMMMKSLREEVPKLLENGVRLMVLGNRSRLSDSLAAAIDDCMAMTAGKKNPGKFTLQFNMMDPVHREVAELLDSMGRMKAQFIANAVQYY